MVGLVRISVAALVRDGLVLLVHRHPLRLRYPDCWDLVGGHVEPGEAPKDAVVRECWEEIGVRVHEPRAFPMRISNPELEMHAFLATRWDGEPVNTEPDEHDDLRWFRPEELAELTMADPASLPDIVNAVRLAESAAASGPF